MIGRATMRHLAVPLACVLFIVAFGAGLLALSQDRHPLSIVDEHIHFDTAVRATHGEIPWRGATMTPELVDEWACGVGHEAGPLPYACGDPRLSADSLPSGKYTTGYIHYPTYFFGAAGFQHVWASVTGDDDLLDGYRAFSAVTMILGVIASAAMGFMLRLRGAALIAATALPVAATMIVYNGMIINPTSATVLCGALIGGTGLRWVRTDRGFAWFAAATAFGAIVGVVHSLPAGGFLIAMLVVLVGRALGYQIPHVPWRPRWWQLVATAVILVTPILLWNIVTSARATITNAELYGFYAPTGRSQVVAGAISELASLHTPWRFTVDLAGEAQRGVILDSLTGLSQGLPLWITVLVFGGLVALTVTTLRMRRVVTDQQFGPQPSPTTAVLIGAALIAGIILYPPALRVSNWITMGFDHPIVERYSIAFAPAIALALMCVRLPRGSAAVLATVGVLSALGAVSPGWA